MKTELKTLKDEKDLKIAYASTGNRDNNFSWGGKAIRIDILKNQAIKDYKAWEKHPNGQNVCSYIKWKNNLTEEDLK